MNIRASQLYRVAACPGSLNAESGLPSTQSEDAAEGTMLHTFHPPEKNLEELTDEQSWAVGFYREKSMEIAGENYATSKISYESELETNIADDITLTGHADFIAQTGGLAIITDAKYGRIPVDPADENWQIMAYAVLAHDVLFASKVIGAIIQPRIEREKRVTVVEYGFKELQAAREKIAFVADAAKLNHDLRKGGDHCKYCKALALCPVAQGRAFEVAKRENGVVITADNAAALYARCKEAEACISAIKREIYLLAKSCKENGQELPGLTLKDGAKRRKIVDAQKAVDRLGLPVELVMPLVDIPIGELETAFKKHAGLKGSAAKQEFESRLGDSMTVKQSEPSLELV